MSHESARQYAQHLKQSLRLQPAIETLSWIFNKTLDPVFLEACAERLIEFKNDPGTFNNLLWNISRLCFTQAGRLADRLDAIRYQCLVPAYFSLIDHLRASLKIPVPAAESSGVGPRRILYVSHQIFMVQHAPTKVCLDYCLELRQQGHEVLVLNVNQLPNDDPLKFAGFLQANVNPQLNGLQPVAHGTGAVPVFSVHPAGLSEAKLATVLRVVSEFRPDWIFSHGEFNAVGDLLAATYPTICLPSGTWEPVSRATGWIDYTAGLSRLRLMQTGLQAEAPLLKKLSNMSPVPDRTRLMQRGEWGLKDDQKVFVLVGNRLPEDIDEPCEQALAQILSKAPQAVLLLVGPERMAWKTRHLEPFASRLFYAGYQTDLRSVLSVCDVFLNPRRPGGGMSAMAALHEKLPVLTLDHGDVGVVMGSSRCCSDWEQWSARAVQLAGNEAELKQARQKAAEVLTLAPGFPAVIRELAEFGYEVERHFRARKKQPSGCF